MTGPVTGQAPPAGQVMTPAEIMLAWTAGGGPPATVVAAVAVALAVSGGVPSAHDPVHGYGLWGIQEAAWGHAGLSVANWADPVANAAAAVALSGGGANWAAWQACWAPASDQPASATLAYPQQGSAAWQRLATAIGGTGGITTAGPAAAAQTGIHNANMGWTALQHLAGWQARSIYGQQATYARMIRSVIR